jgi:hypothetical protein
MGWFKDLARWAGFKKTKAVGHTKPKRVTYLRRFDNKRNENARRRRQIETGVLGPSSRGVV